jgi:UPF0716 family protein affecting phage T7 exclusion
MSARPRLVRSIPFWILIVGSLATSGFGLWLATDKLGVMTATLADGTATGVEVYVGQVWAIVGGILIATGLIGLGLALVLGVVRSFVPQPTVEVVEAIAWSDDVDSADSADDAEPVDVVAEPTDVIPSDAPVEETAAADDSELESAPQR